MMGKVFLMAFTMQLYPQVSPTPQLFTKTFHTTDIPLFLPDFENVVGGSPEQQTLASKANRITVTGWLKGTCSPAVAQTS